MAMTCAEAAKAGVIASLDYDIPEVDAATGRVTANAIDVRPAVGSLVWIGCCDGTDRLVRIERVGRPVTVSQTLYADDDDPSRPDAIGESVAGVVVGRRKVTRRVVEGATVKRRWSRHHSGRPAIDWPTLFAAAAALEAAAPPAATGSASNRYVTVARLDGGFWIARRVWGHWPAWAVGGPWAGAVYADSPATALAQCRDDYESRRASEADILPAGTL